MHGWVCCFCSVCRHVSCQVAATKRGTMQLQFNGAVLGCEKGYCGGQFFLDCRAAANFFLYPRYK